MHRFFNECDADVSCHWVVFPLLLALPFLPCCIHMEIKLLHLQTNVKYFIFNMPSSLACGKLKPLTLGFARLSVELFDLSVCQSVNTFMTCSVYITLTVYITCAISWLANPIQTWRTLPWLLQEILDFSVSPYSFSFQVGLVYA